MTASRDRRFVLGILGAMLVVIIAFSVFAPANDDTDLSPTTYNSGSAGTKAFIFCWASLAMERAVRRRLPVI